MKYKIILSKTFEKDAKPLLKKYSSLKKDLQELGKILIENPNQGKP